MTISEERLYQVLLGPQISEKATMLGERLNQVVFRVASDATKPEIKAAVEKLFEVEVQGVRVLNVKGKEKRMGRITGRRSGWKKALVSLKPGQELSFMAGE